MTIHSIGSEMATQDNRATQFPLFVVQVDYRLWVYPGQDYDEFERKEETDRFELCDECKKLYDADEVLPDECDHCEDGAFDHYKLVEQFDLRAGVFFTSKACNEHIQANAYHYKNPRSFGVGAWRNPEMQAVMKHLIVKGAFKKLPSHYSGGE